MTQWGLDVLFNPSKRHMDEEKQRLQATRPIIGDASGGKRIDLESGKVRIKSKRPAAPKDDASADTSSSAETSSEVDEGAETDSTSAEPDVDIESVITTGETVRTDGA